MSNSSDDSYSEDDEEEELDPRIQDELEKLNAATNSINHLEAELDESRAIFRQTLAGATYQLNALAAKLGKCVEKSRPFYESYRQLKQAHYMLQKSTNQFERATGMHVAAKTRVTEAELRVFGGPGEEKRGFDTALQEMLNQATIEVNDAEKMKRESWKKHQEDLQAYRELEAKVKKLLKKLKSPVEKAKPYFELKSEFDRHLWQLKLRVDSIHKGLGGAKENYSSCLKSLEVISDEIHEKRKSKRMESMLAKLHEREAGVGADSSNEDEVSLTPSGLDLDFDISLKFDNIDGLAAGTTDGKGEDDEWRGIQPTVVVIDSEKEEIMMPFVRTIQGCEEPKSAAPPLSDRQEVYGLESEGEDDAARGEDDADDRRNNEERAEEIAGVEEDTSNKPETDTNSENGADRRETQGEEVVPAEKANEESAVTTTITEGDAGTNSGRDSLEQPGDEGLVQDTESASTSDETAVVNTADNITSSVEVDKCTDGNNELANTQACSTSEDSPGTEDIRVETLGEVVVDVRGARDIGERNEVTADGLEVPSTEDDCESGTLDNEDSTPHLDSEVPRAHAASEEDNIVTTPS